MAITDCLRYVPIQYLILAQTTVLLPFALVRNIAKLSTLALVADVFILTGLVYIFGSEFAIIADRGIAQVDLFNAKDFPLLIGCARVSYDCGGEESEVLIPHDLIYSGRRCFRLRESDWYVRVVPHSATVDIFVADRMVQVVPITDSMREPRKFPAVLTGVMLFLMGSFVLHFV
jgi:proton-coupled amino acid transporter